MKARVKATGEIVEVTECGQTFKDMRMDYMDMKGRCYESEDLDFSDNTPFDYWTRLEHHYAGMAMQTMLATLYNPRYHKELMACYIEVDVEEVARLSKVYAHALVEKMKEKEERK